MTKFYNEPEFKVVSIKSEDVVSTSIGGELEVISEKWDTASTGNDGIVGFGL